MDATGTGLLRATVIAGVVISGLAVAGAAGLSSVSDRLSGRLLAASVSRIDPETTGALPAGLRHVVLDPCTGQQK